MSAFLSHAHARDPRAGVPCRIVCLIFSAYTALCLLMPWSLYVGAPAGSSRRVPDAALERLAEVPPGIAGVPGVVGALAGESIGAALLFVAVSAICAAALVLIVIGIVRVFRFRGGVGLLRGGLGLVAFAAFIAGPAIFMFYSARGLLVFWPTSWPMYAFFCAAVATIAAARYDRLAGPDTAAIDVQLASQGYELDERRDLDADETGGWYERAEYLERRGRSSDTVFVLRVLACVFGVLWVLLTVPIAAGLVSIGVQAAATLSLSPGDALRTLGVMAATGGEDLAIYVLWLTAIVLIVQGALSFARWRRGTGCLRSGALVACLGAAMAPSAIYVGLVVGGLLVPGMTSDAATQASIWWAASLVCLALLAAILSGFADGMAFSRAARELEGD